MAQHSEAYKRIMRKRRKKAIFKRRITAGVACGAVLIGVIALGCFTENDEAETETKESLTTYTSSPQYTAEEWEQVQAEKAAYDAEEQAEAEALKKSIEEYNEAYQKAQEEAFLAARGDWASYSFIDDVSTSLIQSRDWDTEDGYLLARIAMAEAESEDTEGKALVICTVLNRVWSDGFPNTIKEVIYEDGQFTPITNGRWDKVEPDEDCYKALRLVESGWDESQGALYFEVTTTEKTWHNTNLKKLFEHGSTTFYTEKEAEQ